MHIVIIGSGITGMTAALLLAREGHAVSLIEKAPVLAPLLKGFSRQGIHFDTGFHFAGGLEPGGLLRKWLKTLGLSLPFSTYTTETEYVCCQQSRKRILSVQEMAEHFPDFQNHIASMQESILSGLAGSPFTSETQKEFPDLLSLKSTALNTVLESFALPQELTAMLKARCMLYGVPPSQANWEHYRLVAGPYLIGSGTLSGCGTTFYNAWKNALAASSVSCLHGKAVTRIHTNALGKLCAVEREDSSVIPCDAVIFTGHPFQLEHILPAGAVRPSWLKHIRELEETAFPFIVYGIADHTVPEHHTWYHMPDEDNFFALDDTDSPHFCIMTGESCANGQKSCIAMGLYRNKPSEHTYLLWKQSLQKKLIHHCIDVLPELHGHWNILESSAHRAMQHWIYGTTGSFYGTAHMHIAMPITPVTKLQGLFLAGQNILLPGMLGSIISAAVACTLLIRSESILNRFRICAKDE